MSWPLVKLVDVCNPKQWKTIPVSELSITGYTVYGVNGIIGYYSKYTHEHPTLMITCRGATCGNLHISKPKSYITGNAMALDSLDENKLNINYLKYYLEFRGFQDVITGSAQPQITRQNLCKVEIPLPPLPVQKQIAKILEQADTLRQQCQQMEQELNALAQSVFLDMFGDPLLNPKGWDLFKVEDLLVGKPQIGATKPSHSDGIQKIVRVGELGKRNLAYPKCANVTLVGNELEKFRLCEGDFLLARAIGSISHLGRVRA